MKKILILILILIMSISFVSCGKKEEKNTPVKEEKDVSILLSTLGKDISAIEKLGDLPEPEVSGLSMMYYTKDVKGYFSGFNMGVQVLSDGRTVKQIYINPSTAEVKVNGFTIGCSIEEMDELFGEGESSLTKKNDKAYYVTYQDESYTMRCTVEEDRVVAVAFQSVDNEEIENGLEDLEGSEDFDGEYKNMDSLLIGLLGKDLGALEDIRKELPILEMVEGFDYQEPAGEEDYNIIYWVDRSKVDGWTHRVNKVALVKNHDFDENTKLITMGVQLNMPIKEAEDAIVEVPSVKDPSKPETHRLKTDYGDLDDDGYVDIVYISYR